MGGSPTNIRCKALHLIKIILAYSPKNIKKSRPYWRQEWGTTRPFLSTALLTEPHVDVTAHTAPSQQAVNLPLQGMEVWMNRHQIQEFSFSFQQYHDKSIPFTKTYGPSLPPPLLILSWNAPLFILTALLALSL